MGSVANKPTMFSKQSLIRLYRLENKGFVQCGQAFFLCFATDLPHLLCESIKDRYNFILCSFSDMQINFCYTTTSRMPYVDDTGLVTFSNYARRMLFKETSLFIQFDDTQFDEMIYSLRRIENNLRQLSKIAEPVSR